jgi:hypothetical protein
LALIAVSVPVTVWSSGIEEVPPWEAAMDVSLDKSSA